MLKLTKLRKERKLTKTEVARATNIALSTLCNLEHGKQYPYPAYIQRLGDYFGVDGQSLFETAEK